MVAVYQSFGPSFDVPVMSPPTTDTLLTFQNSNKRDMFRKKELYCWHHFAMNYYNVLSVKYRPAACLANHHNITTRITKGQNNSLYRAGRR